MIIPLQFIKNNSHNAPCLDFTVDEPSTSTLTTPPSSLPGLPASYLKTCGAGLGQGLPHPTAFLPRHPFYDPHLTGMLRHPYFTSKARYIQLQILQHIFSEILIKIWEVLQNVWNCQMHGENEWNIIWNQHLSVVSVLDINIC